MSSACPCESVTFPQVICNLPGLPAISYRVGDFVAFRYRLLQALPNETELTLWRPGASGDLAVQMVEWWAYLADILTFYNERIANEDYLTTAQLPESVNHLVQLLGYRPRPALGATGTLAALLSPSAQTPLSLPAGLQIQSKPGPGQSPQVFESTAPTSVSAPDIIAADVVPAQEPLLGSSFVWLAGKVSGIKSGDRLLLITSSAIDSQTVGEYEWISVTGTTPQKDPLGNPVTQVNFTVVSGTIDSSAQAEDYVLLRSSQSSPLWGFPTTSSVISELIIDPIILKRALASLRGGALPSLPTVTLIELAGIARTLSAGSLLLLDAASATDLPATPFIVIYYTEVVWYANGDGPTAPSSSPIGIPHAAITVGTLANATTWEDDASQVTVRWGWSQVGQLVPVLMATDYLYSGGSTELIPAPGAADFPSASAAVLLEDPSGYAASATTSSATPPAGATSAITLNCGQPSTLPSTGLASPISVMFNSLPVSRGKTVASEVLGSGNPAVAGQDFTLSQSPVTYFADPASISGYGFSSTVQVSVNGVLWSEVPTFYGQSQTAQVFVLREDDQGATHVTFGDGVNGALLPTGTNNVVATYRYGAGAAAPAAETLTNVLTPQPGLKGVRNPLQPTGGSDPDSQAKLTTLAPRSVLTFGRAVSLDDYAAIAATASGVTQVTAGFTFDAQAQRPMVTLWVAGDTGAVAAVQAALNGITVPYQPLNVIPANPIDTTLSLTYVRDASYADAAVQAGLTTALVDPNVGLFGANVIGIGQVIYDSQIAAACLAVPGVLAIHNVSLTSSDGLRVFTLFPINFRLPRFGGAPAPPGCTGQQHSPGAGNYFSVLNDSQHLVLSGTIGS